MERKGIDSNFGREDLTFNLKIIMLEKEIKILEIDVEEVTSKLVELGAKKTFEGFIHDVYYDFPDDGKSKMEANKRMFRVRQKGEEHIYTIKRKRKKVKKEEGLNAKDEHETAISDVKSFAKVLEKYGMTKMREKKKYRISYNLNGVEFDIDDYYIWDSKNEIPPLLEIEASGMDEIQEWVKRLGLEEYEQKLFGSRSLFKHYGQDYSVF